VVLVVSLMVAVSLLSLQPETSRTLADKATRILNDQGRWTFFSFMGRSVGNVENPLHGAD